MIFTGTLSGTLIKGRDQDEQLGLWVRSGMVDVFSLRAMAEGPEGQKGKRLHLRPGAESRESSYLTLVIDGRDPISGTVMIEDSDMEPGDVIVHAVWPGAGFKTYGPEGSEEERFQVDVQITGLSVAR